jgi:hypothetical protein
MKCDALFFGSFWGSDATLQVSEFLSHNSLLVALILFPIIAALVPRAWDRRTEEFSRSWQWALRIVLALLVTAIPVCLYLALRK